MIFAVYEVAGEAIKRAREGGGPTLLSVRSTDTVTEGCSTSIDDEVKNV